VGRSVRQALYLAAWPSALGMAALLLPGPLLRWTEVPPALQAEVRHYLAILALALPPALLFRMYSTLNQSLGWPVLVTWLQIGSLVVKAPLSVWFTFGGLGGLPAMGVVGCAWATLVVNYLMLALALWLLRTQPCTGPTASGAGWSGPTGQRLPRSRAWASHRPGHPGGGDLVHADGAVHRAPGHGRPRPATRSPPTWRRCCT
jgi:Na+-driven multidrug efflux pump